MILENKVCKKIDTFSMKYLCFDRSHQLLIAKSNSAMVRSGFVKKFLVFSSCLANHSGPESELVLTIRPSNYGSTGCGVLKRGIQN